MISYRIIPKHKINPIWINVVNGHAMTITRTAINRRTQSSRRGGRFTSDCAFAPDGFAFRDINTAPTSGKRSLWHNKITARFFIQGLTAHPNIIGKRRVLDQVTPVQFFYYRRIMSHFPVNHARHDHLCPRISLGHLIVHPHLVS